MARLLGLRPRMPLRIRCEGDPQSTPRKTQAAPEVNTPRAPPPPAPPPPPPAQPEAKIFGVNRRFAMSLLVGVPLGLAWRSYLQTERIKEEVIATVVVPKQTSKGVRKIRKDVKFVKGKNGMLYVVGTDKRGRKYMVDANGILFYDSGVESVGWYAVDLDGEVTNFYPENGQVKVKSVGNISEMKPYQIDEFMGLPIEARRWVAFEDAAVKPLAPNVPLVQSGRDGSWVPPFFIDEGEVVLEEKKLTNPFAKRNGGGKFRREPE